MNRICLIFDLNDDGSLPEIPEMFGYPAVKVIADDVDFDTNTLRLYMSHPYFPEFMGSHEHIRYDTARKRFPWLFTNTNPLLYKKFRRDISWTKQVECTSFFKSRLKY
jgi:hypothetical protein